MLIIFTNPEKLLTMILKLKVLNPLDAICNQPRNDAVCVNQLKNARGVDEGILQERPDVKIFLPFRFLFYRPEELFQPHQYNRYLGKDRVSDLTTYYPHYSTVKNHVVFNFKFTILLITFIAYINFIVHIRNKSALLLIMHSVTCFNWKKYLHL